MTCRLSDSHQSVSDVIKTSSKEVSQHGCTKQRIYKYITFLIRVVFVSDFCTRDNVSQQEFLGQVLDSPVMFGIQLQIFSRQAANICTIVILLEFGAFAV